MLKYLFLLFISLPVMAKPDWRAMEKEIKNLPAAKVGDYWVALHIADQDNNDGDDGDEELDVINLYKVVLMVHYHGYPTSQQYGYPAYVTPWIAWSHCQSARLKQYTFPMILQGKALGQLPENLYPNYFISGYLLDTYGLDMEFDKSFDEGRDIISEALKIMEDDNHKIDPAVVQKMAEEWISSLNEEYKGSQFKYSWLFLQHQNNNYFSFIQAKDGLILLTRQEEGIGLPHRLVFHGKDEYEVEGGLGLFRLRIRNGQLQFISTKTGNVVKLSSDK